MMGLKQGWAGIPVANILKFHFGPTPGLKDFLEKLGKLKNRRKIFKSPISRKSREERKWA